MKNAIIVLVLGLIFVGFGYFGGRWHERSLSPGPVVDTLYVQQPVKPDTVLIDKILYRDVVKYKPVVVDCTTIVYDTTYVTVADTIFKSFKLFEYPPYVTSAVYMWAKSPVDSVGNDVKVQWGAYHSDKVRPQLKQAKSSGRYQGFIAGVAATAAAFILIK